MPEFRDTVTSEIYIPEDLELQVCHSAAGYYIGQREPCGVPFSRLSDYYKTETEASNALRDGFKWRMATENVWLIKAIEAKRRRN